MLFNKKQQVDKKKELPNKPLVYPVGSVVRTEQGLYYIKKAGIRMTILSNSILDSWNFHRVIDSNEIALKNYTILGKLGFRSGSLLHNISNGKLYLVSENKLRHIQSPEALSLIGAEYNDAMIVSNADINLHSEGDALI